MSKYLVNERVRKKIEEVLAARKRGDCEYNPEDSFFVLDPVAIDTQFKLWQEQLPKATPHYAVKCNNHPEIVKRLIKHGAHFDCASQSEIKLVLALGASASNIIYANPVKAPSQLKYAAEVGVKRMTFDNTAELHKIKENAPGSELLIRIKTDDSGAVCSLSCKFGAALQQAESLLETARGLGLNVVGVAYHVGSGGGTGPEAHAKALQDVHDIYELASSKYGYKMSVIDFGGGFDADAESFSAVAKQIKLSLESLKFPSNIDIMGEPGRFFAAPALTLLANVIGVRRAPNANETDMAYLTDGVYGNLNSIIYDHQHPQPYLVGDWEKDVARPQRASLWGPTCDGLDSITTTAHFPQRLDVGDWIYFPDVGAYTLVGESAFNGFNTNTQVFTADE